MKNKISIAVVDDQFLFRQGLIALINDFKEINVLFEASNGVELLEQLEQQQPEVILLDLEMPLMDGSVAAAKIKKKYPKIKIIILTMYKEDGLILDLIERGVKGFLTKEAGIEFVVDAIHGVMENEYFFNDKISITLIKELSNTKKINPIFKTTPLSEKEITIVRLICKQYTNKEIADKLCLSPKTIDVHRGSILKKTSAKNTAGIVMYAVKNNLLN